jgi:hypothetical protein
MGRSVCVATWLVLNEASRALARLRWFRIASAVSGAADVRLFFAGSL